jgi:group I intron endonuclease
MIIYKTVNIIDNKIYVGKQEKDNHNYLGSGVHLKRAIKKYSRENFKKEIIDCAHSRKELCEKEIYWIDFYRSRDLDVGYNITKGGEGSDYWKGKKFSDEHRKRISKAFSGEGNPFYGKCLTDEHKANMSKSLKGKKVKPRSDEYRKYLSESRKGENNPNYRHGKNIKEGLQQHLVRFQ